MDQTQSSRIQLIASNKRKKTTSLPLTKPPKIHDQSLVQLEVYMENPPLFMYDRDLEKEEMHFVKRRPSQRRGIILDQDSEEEKVRPIREGPVDLMLFKSFRIHIAYFVSKNKVKHKFLFTY